MSFDHAFAERVLEQIRTVLKKRGADGVRGLMRNFKICDGDGSGQLNEEELAKCFRLCKLTLSPAESMSLFRFFDKNGNGLVSFDEFIKTVRGKMNQPRRNLVVKAFRRTSGPSLTLGRTRASRMVRRRRQKCSRNLSQASRVRAETLTAP